LDRVIAVADKKLYVRGNSDKIKQGWARILVSAIAAYGSILKDSELETLEDRIARLEKLSKKPIKWIEGMDE
jgi:hypothetical protein